MAADDFLTATLKEQPSNSWKFSKAFLVPKKKFLNVCSSSLWHPYNQAPQTIVQLHILVNLDPGSSKSPNDGGHDNKEKDPCLCQKLNSIHPACTQSFHSLTIVPKFDCQVFIRCVFGIMFSATSRVCDTKTVINLYKRI